MVNTMSGVVTVERFAAPEPFEAAMGPWLLPREAEHALLLGLLAGMRAGSWDPGEAWLLGVRRGGRPVGAAVRTPPHRLVLGLVDGDDAVDALARHLARRPEGVELPGVTGPSREAEAFARRWRALLGVPWHRTTRLRLHRCDAVRPGPRVPGHLRPAHPDDLPLLTDFVAGFQRDTGVPTAGDPEATARRYLEGADRGLTAWERGGRVRAIAGWSGPTPNGVRISLVYTPPGERRRGYAGALVRALTRRLLDRGHSFVTLYTDADNATANHVYREAGFEALLEALEVGFGAP